MNTNNVLAGDLLPLDEPGSQEFLKNFAENQIDDDIGNFIRDYENQSRLFSIPRLNIFDAHDINHRKADLFFLVGFRIQAKNGLGHWTPKGADFIPLCKLILRMQATCFN